MKKYNRREVPRDDEDDDELYDHGEDLDWSELGSLYMHVYDVDADDPDFSLLGSYARDARCERRETRHHRI